VRNIFKKHKSARLRGILLWVPMLKADSESEVPAERGREKRVWQDWDGSKSLSKVFGTTLKLKRDAWDVYLVYPAGTRWESDAPPPPAFWMHQLSSGADPGLKLDAKVFEEAVVKQLSR
jgi:hypothetical protein